MCEKMCEKIFLPFQPHYTCQKTEGIHPLYGVDALVLSFFIIVSKQTVTTVESNIFSTNPCNCTRFCTEKTLKSVAITAFASPVNIPANVPENCKNPCNFWDNNAIATTQQNKVKNPETVDIATFSGINITDIRHSYIR